MTSETGNFVKKNSKHGYKAIKGGSNNPVTAEMELFKIIAKY